MSEVSIKSNTCGKDNRCIHGEDCPYNKFPIPSYLCFERGFTTTEMKRQQRRLENENNRT